MRNVREGALRVACRWQCTILGAAGILLVSSSGMAQSLADLSRAASPISTGASGLRSAIIEVEQLHESSKQLADVEKYREELLRAIRRVTAIVNAVKLESRPDNRNLGQPPIAAAQAPINVDSRAQFESLRRQITDAKRSVSANSQQNTQSFFNLINSADGVIRSLTPAGVHRLGITWGGNEAEAGAPTAIAFAVERPASRAVDDVLATLESLRQVQVSATISNDRQRDWVGQVSTAIRAISDKLKELEERNALSDFINYPPGIFAFAVERSQIPTSLSPSAFQSVQRISLVPIPTTPFVQGIGFPQPAQLSGEDYSSSLEKLEAAVDFAEKVIVHNQGRLTAFQAGLGAAGEALNRFRADSLTSLTQTEKQLTDALEELRKGVQDRKAKLLDELSKSMGANDSHAASLNLFGLMLLAFVVSLIGLHLVIRLFENREREIIFRSNSILHVFTVFTIISAITILAMTSRIEPKDLVTLLAAISGYVLGQLGRQSAEGSSASPRPATPSGAAS